MSIIIAILVFGGIILVHELGHFFAARKCGVKVEEFAIGMGPRILHRKFGETIYSLRLFPIGGSCRMLGEDESNSDRRAFNNKPVLPRIVIILAGAFMNFVLALVIATGVIMVNGYTSPTVSAVVSGSPAEQVGLMPGDRIIEADGTKINIFYDMTFLLQDTQAKPISLTILRDGKKIQKQVTPYAVQSEDGITEYRIGFNAIKKDGFFSEQREGFEKAGIFDSIQNGFYTNVFYVKTALVGISRLATLKIGIDQMSGPIGVTNAIGETYEKSMEFGVKPAVLNVLNLMAFLSANIGIFNLLPFPALDGGRFIFLLLEAIRRKPVKPEIEGMIHFVGFTLLMILTVFILYNDIVRLLH